MLTFLVLNVADTKQKLGNDVFQAAGVAQKYNCSLVRLDYQQEQGLVSSLPLGINQIKIQRSLTTSNVAVFVPFVTQELFQSGADGVKVIGVLAELLVEVLAGLVVVDVHGDLHAAVGGIVVVAPHTGGILFLKGEFVIAQNLLVLIGGCSYQTGTPRPFP